MANKPYFCHLCSVLNFLFLDVAAVAKIISLTKESTVRFIAYVIGQRVPAIASQMRVYAMRLVDLSKFENRMAHYDGRSLCCRIR